MLALYVDESCADGRNRYLVHGALFLRDHQIVQLREGLATIVSEFGFRDELKWSALSKAKLDRERAAVDCYFAPDASHQESGYRFQSLIVDQHKVDVVGFHDGDKDMCFYKFLYQLLRKRIAAFAYPGERVNIVLDERTTKRYDLDDLKASLNNGLRIDRQLDPPVVRSVMYRDSRAELLLQLSDLLSGAVGFFQNRHHESGLSSAHKLALAQHIASRAKARDLTMAQRHDDALGIWTLQMRARIKKGLKI